MNRVKEILKRIETITPWPVTTSRLVKLVGREDHSINDLVRLISLDAGLTMRVLRVANSARYARRERCSSVGQAIAILGEQIVVGIAIGAGAGEVFLSSMDGYGGSTGDLWKHSLRTAFAAREFSRYARQCISAEDAFTAGLLHDIGKSVIANYIGVELGGIVSRIDTVEGDTFLSEEHNLLGLDHTEVGAEIARSWNLPDQMLESIAFHHKPSAAAEQFRTIVFAVHLADIAAMSLGDGTGADTLTYGLDGEYPRYYQLSRVDFEKILTAAESRFMDAVEFISFNGGS
jgi:putative nucleotidyltransferase with HDIG domain